MIGQPCLNLLQASKLEIDPGPWCWGGQGWGQFQVFFPCHFPIYPPSFLFPPWGKHTHIQPAPSEVSEILQVCKYPGGRFCTELPIRSFELGHGPFWKLGGCFATTVQCLCLCFCFTKTLTCLCVDFSSVSFAVVETGSKTESSKLCCCFFSSEFCLVCSVYETSFDNLLQVTASQFWNCVHIVIGIYMCLS